MAQFPSLPLWTDSYLADTMHLDCLESGAYLHLLIAAWRSPDCSLPDDDKRLARFAKCTPRQWKKVKPTVMEFWTLSEHKWFQKRLLKERNYVSDKREQQSQAGKASALKRLQSSSTDVASPLQRKANGKATPIPIPIPTTTPKEVFKNTKKGGKINGKKVSLEGMERGKEIAPGYDIYFIEDQFKKWSADKTIRNQDAAFIKFVKTHVRKNPI